MSNAGRDASNEFRSRISATKSDDHAPGTSASPMLQTDHAVIQHLAMEDGRDYLISQQSADGMWMGRVAGDIQSTAGYILLQFWLDQTGDESVVAAARFLLETARESGGWAATESLDSPEGLPSELAFDLNASVIAYLAVRLLRDEAGVAIQNSGTGQDAEAILARAVDSICQAGGVESCNVFVRCWLALFGLAAFPDASELSGSDAPWVMGTETALAILLHRRPTKPLSSSFSIAELQTHASEFDRQVPLYQRLLDGARRLRGLSQIESWRRPGLTKKVHWMTDNVSADDGLVGPWHASLFAIIALIASGESRHGSAASDLQLAVKGALLVEGSGGKRKQALPVFRAPSTDTALAVCATNAIKVEDDYTPRVAMEWLLSRELSNDVDASLTDFDSGGWCREFSNRGFANLPATAMVLMALRQQFSQKPPSSLVTDDSMVAIIRANSLNLAHRQIAVLDRVAAASRRARRWLVSSQNKDGGWGHFEPALSTLKTRRQRRGGTGATDSSTVASTGRVLQGLGAWDMACGQTAVDRAVTWLRRTQKNDGSWNAMHDAVSHESTCMAINGLRAVGLPRRDAMIQEAARWLQRQQRASGGWNMAGQPTNDDSDALATAWAILALSDAGYRDSEAVGRAAAWLVSVQRPDGKWPSSPALDTMPDVPSLSFRTSVSVTAYAMLALNACESNPAT